MSITQSLFGQSSDGQNIQAFTISNAKGTQATIIEYGATLTKLILTDEKSNSVDIVLGFDKLSDYESASNPYFGATIGRWANRIKDGRFKIEERFFQVTTNEGQNHLHGGGFGALSKHAWKGEILSDSQVRLSTFSPDKEEGFPGNLKVSVTYSLNDDNELAIDYHAISDQDTILNLTNHSYFNIAGVDSGSIHQHKLHINCSHYAPTKADGIPDGRILTTENTPLDFTKESTLNSSLKSLHDSPQRGLDHGFLIDKDNNWQTNPVANYKDPISGRSMQVFTSEPALQIYTANYVENINGKNNVIYNKQQAICFECQNLADAVNQKNFPSSILRRNEAYISQTVFKLN